MPRLEAFFAAVGSMEFPTPALLSSRVSCNMILVLTPTVSTSTSGECVEILVKYMLKELGLGLPRPSQFNSGTYS